ncbi:MAG TPA: nitrate- and nitrite sensing domain-containing protein [Actinocrinis sp.]|nr:nitrate- and nitrite sensing domain-containing protein [Actinocrinis sp.]
MSARLPLRVVLLVLAFVPSAAMVALLAVNSGRLYDDWNTATNQENAVVSSNGAVPATVLYYDLQQERRLSAAAIADPAAYKAGLAQVRKLTDSSASTLAALSGITSPGIVASLQNFQTQLRQLSGFRAAVDDGTVTQQGAYDDYTGLIGANLDLFAALTRTGVPELDVITAPSIPTGWGEEMISREDAIITAGAASGRLTLAQRAQIAQAVGAEQFIYQDQVIPAFTAMAGPYQGLLAGKTWQQKTQVEQSIADAPASAAGVVAVPPALGQQWQQMMSALTPELQHLTLVGSGEVVAAGNAEVGSLKTRLIAQSALGAGGVVLVIGFTWWLVNLLRRRIFALRLAAEELETRLPDVVERLRGGEPVDTDAELPVLHYGRDELGMLGRALNAARASALETSVRQVEQYRGFERLLQRIARRTQLLIGLQMKRLSEMERQHEDATVLEGLFDLDHLTARLRRYEENLVILGGGQTQRRWRKPVPLLDVLRSAQSEVQDYRRIRVETQSRVWISEHAVGALVHVLAELMENAVAFSKPPSPVEVTAAPVARGLAVEIEDRGMGLDAEQYARANALMTDPPRMDVLSRADDARLGLYVVARLAAKLGVKVELRPSAFGGTRVVVLVPAEIVLAGDRAPASEPGEDEVELTPRLSLVADPPLAVAASGLNVNGFGHGVGIGIGESAGPQDESDRLLAGVGGRAQDAGGAPPLDPLPRRVRQASLVAELREKHGGGGEAPADGDAQTVRPAHAPGRSAATVGAFQRQSRLARLAADDEAAPAGPSPDTEQSRQEDGR